MAVIQLMMRHGPGLGLQTDSGILRVYLIGILKEQEEILLK